MRSASRPKSVCGDIVEIGADSGRLAVDMLVALAARDTLPGRYRILEGSADLRERQQQRIGELPAQLAVRVKWLEPPPLQGWRGVLLANEVLDALPCECFSVRHGEVFKRGVALDPLGRPAWQARPASPALHAEIERTRVDAGAMAFAV